MRPPKLEAERSILGALAAPAAPAHSARWARWSCVPSILVFTLLGLGCAGHAATTKDARAALDRGQPREALQMYNQLLEVDSANDLPDQVQPDQQLYVLDRSMVLQSIDDYQNSSRDLQTADKGVEMLDFSRSTMDDISKFVFSDDSGPYVAPPYEKLMINTMNMMNYLARGDLNGARIEARRFAVMQKYLNEHENPARSMLGPGSYLAGFTFEKSQRADEALLYYDEALAYGEYRSLKKPLKRLCKLASKVSPRIKEAIEGVPDLPADDDSGELLVIVNYGRVPPKKANRIPIGLALTIASDAISPRDRSRANQLAAQGLVTWVNFASLGKPSGQYDVPRFMLDGREQPTEMVLAVDKAAHQAYEDIKGTIIASAITRLITRLVAGEATRQAAGGGVVGTLLSLGTQATMTAADTPDTRSWATLPARIAIARVRVPAGEHKVGLMARGASKTETVNVQPGGWAAVVLTSLR
ncbi:MAG: hypothetical protein OXU20_32645 [Myxococcales bacterium]|nr:hypothetical protein [Myxococcales bacterium]MDD9964942.1 hypothetical protein [Myxococcales bacterium]